MTAKDYFDHATSKRDSEMRKLDAKYGKRYEAATDPEEVIHINEWYEKRKSEITKKYVIRLMRMSKEVNS